MIYERNNEYRIGSYPMIASSEWPDVQRSMHVTLTSQCFSHFPGSDVKLKQQTFPIRILVMFFPR